MVREGEVRYVKAARLAEVLLHLLLPFAPSMMERDMI